MMLSVSPDVQGWATSSCGDMGKFGFAFRRTLTRNKVPFFVESRALTSSNYGFDGLASLPTGHLIRTFPGAIIDAIHAALLFIVDLGK